MLEKLRKNALLLLFSTLVLLGAFLRVLPKTVEAPLTPPAVSATASAVPSAVPSAANGLGHPAEWPPVRFIELVSGEWSNNAGVFVSVVSPRRKKTRDWQVTITIPKENGTPDETILKCEVVPEMRDDAYRGTCSGMGLEKDSPLLLRLRMNHTHNMYIETHLFEIVVRPR